MENINCSQSYNTLSDGHFGKYGPFCVFLEAKISSKRQSFSGLICNVLRTSYTIIVILIPVDF